MFSSAHLAVYWGGTKSKYPGGMSKAPKKRKKAPTLRELYPDLNDEQLKEAEFNLDRYAAFLLRISERLASERGAYPEKEALTQPDVADTKDVKS